MQIVLFANISQMIFKLVSAKCCNQIVYDINNMTEEIKVKMRDYGIKAVPTTVIDGISKL